MNVLNQIAYRLNDLVADLNVTIQGDANCVITGVATIQEAETGHITFLTNALYKKFLASTRASVVILTEECLNNCPVTAIVTPNPYFIYAKIAEFFNPKSITTKEVHQTAVIGENTDINPSATIGAHCVIGKNVVIAANVVIGANCVIGDDVQIDEATVLDANVTIYRKVKIGKRTHITSGVVIGGDGFGFAHHEGAWHKVPQLGGVSIGDDVDIGANTTIDRGAIDDTVIENGVKLDNQIQIGHNVRIGAHTIIAGCCAIAGTTIIGKNCMIGGSSNFAGHLTVCDQTVITGGTDVTKSILEPGIYSSGIVGAVSNLEFRKNNARFYRLENLFERVKSVEAALKIKDQRDKT